MSLLLLVGLAAIGLGLFLGSLLHVAIVEILATLIAVDLPLPTAAAILLGAATGLICALAFAMAFIHLKNVAPMRVIRRDLGVAPLSRWLSYGAAAGGSLVLWFGIPDTVAHLVDSRQHCEHRLIFGTWHGVAQRRPGGGYAGQERLALGAGGLRSANALARRRF